MCEMLVYKVKLGFKRKNLKHCDNRKSQYIKHNELLVFRLTMAAQNQTLNKAHHTNKIQLCLDNKTLMKSIIFMITDMCLLCQLDLSV